MSRTTLGRLHRLEVKARLDGSLQDMTDSQLFGPSGSD